LHIQDAAIKNHEDFEIRDAGLYVDASVTYLDASPNGIITCKCHGMGVLKIKCPYCFKEQLLQEATEDSAFCLEQQNNKWQLKINHTYYYQVQMQMTITQTIYCGFVVWSQNNYFIIMVEFDREFYYSKMESLKYFFVYGMLAEIVEKWYTRKPILDMENIIHTPTSPTAQNEDQEEEDYS